MSDWSMKWFVTHTHTHKIKTTNNRDIIYIYIYICKKAAQSSCRTHRLNLTDRTSTLKLLQASQPSDSRLEDPHDIADLFLNALVSERRERSRRPEGSLAP